MDCSGSVRKPFIQSAMLSSTPNAADCHNSVSGSTRTWITHNVDCVTDSVAIVSGVRPSSDLQSPSTVSHSLNVASTVTESDCQSSQHADETLLEDLSDELSSCEMYASPAPNDCLNDIWLSSAAVDLGSPIMSRVSAVVHEHAN